MPATARSSAAEPLLIPPRDAALILGVTRQTIYNLIAAGKLRRVHIGRASRVRLDEVYALAGGAPDHQHDEISA